MVSFLSQLDEPASVAMAVRRAGDRLVEKLSGAHVGAANSSQPPAFYSVAETARMFGMSEMTLYRAIAAGQFPAVRIRGRLIVPARAIQVMVDSALGTGAVVNAADWVPRGAA